MNVIALLGVVASDYKLMAVVEFCELGNLKDYLQDQKDNFLNQINKMTGELIQDLEKEIDEDSYVNIESKTAEGFCEPIEKKISTQDLVHFVYQIARGMQYIHSKKVNQIELKNQLTF